MSPEFQPYPASFSTAMAAIPDWLYEASNPYWEWLWGSPAEALVRLSEWVCRPTSEVSATRVVFLSESDIVLGGYIAVAGSELQRCRKADLLALVNFLRRNHSDSIMMRMRQAKSLFGSASQDEYYLSRLGVNHSCRGRGVGQQLVEKYLKEGKNKGFTRFRVDVSVDNKKAIHLYLAAGFVIEREIVIEETSIRYCSMTAIF